MKSTVHDVKTTRLQHGLTQAELASRFGIDRKTVNRIERQLHTSDRGCHTEKRLKREMIRLWALMERKPNG